MTCLLVFVIFGLIPGCPLLWQAFQALPDLTSTYFLQPCGQTWHVFTDGEPHDSDESLVAWAAVYAAKGIIPSVFNRPSRKQISLQSSMLLSWIERREGTLHLSVDNQHVLDTLKYLM